VSDDDETGSRWVRLRQGGDRFSDASEVLRVGLAGGGGPRLSLGLVTDEDVDVGKDLLNLGLEELRDEGCGEVEGEGLYEACSNTTLDDDEGPTDLSSQGSIFCNLDDSLGAVGKEVALDVEELGGLDQRCNLCALKVRFFELLCRSEGGNERSRNCISAQSLPYTIRFDSMHTGGGP
jgi:hypothetical protein